MIDECLKASIIEKMHNPENSSVFLETIYLTLRMSQIVEKFAGRRLEISFGEIKNQYSKICKQVKEKAFHDLIEALDFEDKNEWNRFPVASDYSHTVIDKAMFQVWKQKQTPEYRKIANLLQKYSCQTTET